MERNATFARIGRSYPRAGRSPAGDAAKPAERRLASRYGAAAAAVIALLLALALTGWLLAAYGAI